MFFKDQQLAQRQHFFHQHSSIMQPQTCRYIGQEGVSYTVVTCKHGNIKDYASMT